MREPQLGSSAVSAPGLYLGGPGGPWVQIQRWPLFSCQFKRGGIGRKKKFHLVEKIA